MGTRTMTSRGGGRQHSEMQSLARQGSLCRLTLNEVQSHLGEPLHSMNLDELLRNVFPGELNQPLAMDLGSGHCGLGLGLQCQGSISVPRALSKKTVDEVWRDIQQKKANGELGLSHGRQPTLGEMTLEDFLVKAGVVAEGADRRAEAHVGNVASVASGDSMAGMQGLQHQPPPPVHWLHQYQQQQQAQQGLMGAYVGRPVPHPLGAGTGAILDAVYYEGQGRSLAGAMPDPQTPGRKRGAAEEVTEKIVERRQKRMIKNRESAARSRARKQAYTNELENKISRLEEENEMLKKQKESESVIHYVLQVEQKYQLRRTSSAPF
ncbi:ABSCISIC ACID-INSENSITIVE 5-like protein 2 [Elaeis guineensis]|uniref:ABSCISIC ACID-INSENSITIVE 5-like protein 2 isoform X2 n=1 Tax=Elaeis guineensis var. tenera TaxID=51953 RepID=A0A6I9QPW8_ELAGV|nr:ABSCISIC ACID-INSENSITIVE 5-like protein 2 isoform X2 [Elaeis guineensis]